MKNDKIPPIERCYEIMEDQQMLSNIKEHSEQVMKVALIILNHLKPGIIINKNLVIAASLLHDITKTRSLSTREKHDITGGSLLRELGYNEVANIVEEHVELKEYQLDGELTEKEIVFYADKRVMHSKIVSVEERISDLIIRYGKTAKVRQLILKNKESILDIEKKIDTNMSKNINSAILCFES